jgi:environmental stress-induced protein Ves
MPWKNGGGETREIAVSPAGTTLETLDWRVSLATVAEDGPFSVFQGVQRTLCVIRGAGIQLYVGDREPAALHSNSEPFTFDGEATTRGQLIDGPIEDLNVMSRRGRYSHRVRRLVLQDALDLDTNAQSLIVYCHRGDLLLGEGAAAENLQPDDSVIFDEPADHIRLAATRSAEIIVVEFFSM